MRELNFLLFTQVLLGFKLEEQVPCLIVLVLLI